MMLTTAINVVADIHCPFKLSTNKAKSVRWMDCKTNNLIKERDWLFREYIKLKIGSEKAEAWVKYKNTRNKVKREVEKRKRDYNAKIINKNSKTDMKTCWRVMNVALGRDSIYRDPVTLRDQGQLIKNHRLVANKFNEFFDEKIRKIRESLPKTTHHQIPSLNEANSFKFSRVDLSQIIQYIRELSKSQAYRLDNISNKLVKVSKFSITKALTSITNNCLEQGKFPSSWKIGKINTIHKKGSKMDVSNYHPICLLPSLSKVIEKAVFDQVCKYYENNDLFDPRQYGFRK